MVSASHTPHNISLGLTITAFILYGSLFIAALIFLFLLISSARRRYWRVEKAVGRAGSERNELLTKRTRERFIGRGTQKTFFYFLLIFILFRLSWFATGLVDREISDSQPDLLEFVLNRGALCTFFSSFTLVFFYWVKSFHTIYFDSDSSFVSLMMWMFILANVLLYGFQGSIIAIYISRHTAWRLEALKRDDVYIASIVVAGASDVFVSMGFLVYGLRLFGINKDLSDDLSPENKRQRVTTLWATLVFCSCFILRFAMFLWVPVSSNSVSSNVFMIFAYILPEIIPTVLQLGIVQNKRSKNQRDERFISDLYAEHDEVRRFEATVDESPQPHHTPHGSFASFPTIATADSMQSNRNQTEVF